MIDKRELTTIAQGFGLELRVVEKDYVLGWLLAGIYHHPELSSNWVFKGGTCLKKCYLETYRFSEDLDFTLLRKEHVSESFLRRASNQIATWVHQQSGIEIPQDSITFNVHPDKDKFYVEGRIGYIGPLQRNRGGVSKIKLDLTANEILVLEPTRCKVYHPYSDYQDSIIQTFSYPYEEVFAEKIRALAQRFRPRDLYDVVHLYRHNGIQRNESLIIDILRKKCDFKGIPLPTIEAMKTHPKVEELISSWESMLKHQIHVLPEVAPFLEALPEVFEGLFQNKKQRMLSSYQVEESSIRWFPQRANNAKEIFPAVERIQMAAANRVCIRLRYGGEKRMVEPYSFRKTKEGKILFYGYHQEDQSIKAFRLDRFQEVQVTNISFSPRYLVEI